MRIALAMFLAAGLFCAGCGKKAIAPAAIAAPASPKAPGVHLQPALFLNEIPSANAATNTVVQWEVILTEFKVEAAQQLGLARLFESSGEKYEIAAEEIGRSPLAQMGRANSNVVLSLLAGGYAARCTFEESTNLMDYFLLTPGIDTLSQPRITTKGTNSALMQIANTMTLVLSGIDKADPGAILATNISVGPTVSARLLAQTDEKVSIEVAARLDEFGGYEANDGKAARPNLKVTAMGTRTELATNEVLLLGSPIRMNLTQTRESVPYLSDIPGLGRLFTETHVHTNFTRLMIMVRPRIQ